MPALIFLTDDERTPDPFPAIAALPTGKLSSSCARAMPNRRRELAHAAARIAQARGLMLSVANDAALAAEVCADGWHFSESEIETAARHRLRPRLLTCAAHSAHAVLRAHRAGAHAVLLSPIFATKSHADREPLGVTRLRTIARASPVPVYALGGIDAANVAQLNAHSARGDCGHRGLNSNLEPQMHKPRIHADALCAVVECAHIAPVIEALPSARDLPVGVDGIGKCRL